MTKYINLAIYIVAAALRLVNLSAASLWYDEVFTYLVTSQDLSSMLRTIMGDVHPPLYYLLIKFMNPEVGLSEFWLRLPSVFFSLLGIYLTGKIARELKLSPAAGWVAMGLVALLPSEIYYAQEARMYALLQALILSWLLVTLQRRWVLAAIYGVMTLYTHNYGVFYLAVIGIIGLARELYRPVILDPDNHNYPWLDRWKRGDEANVRGALLAAAVPALAFIPWVGLVMLGQMKQIAANYWIAPITLGQIGYHVYMLFVLNFTADIPVMSAMAIYGLIFWSIYRSRQAMENSAWRVLLAVGYLPLLLAIFASLVWRPILTYRYIFGSLPMICLMIGAAITNIKPWKAAYIGALCIPLLLGGLWSYYDKLPDSKGLIRRDIGLLRMEWQPGDQLLHTNSSSYLIWRAYAPDLNQVLLPQCDERNHGELSEQTRQALDVYGSTDPSHHTWLLYDITPLSTNCELDRANAMIGTTSPSIWLYQTRNTTTAIYELKSP